MNNDQINTLVADLYLNRAFARSRLGLLSGPGLDDAPNWETARLDRLCEAIRVKT